MSGFLTTSDRVARAIVGPALGLMLGVAPRLGRATRPMPIDPSVQEPAPELQATRPAPARSERLHPVTRTA